MKLYIILSLLLFGIMLNAQTNLVKNGSFEIKSSCPQLIGSISLVQNWGTANLGSPDYFNSCNSSSLGVPLNLFGWQNALNGEAYIGINTFAGGNSQEYLEGEIQDSLITGKKYLVSFRVSPANGMPYANNSIGAYISSSIVYQSHGLNLNYQSQINNVNQNLTDTALWYTVTDTFVSTNNEKYITIGCFSPDSLVDTVQIANFPGVHAYYYIDSITIFDLSQLGINNIFHANDYCNLFFNYIEHNVDIQCDYPINNFEIYNSVGQLITIGSGERFDFSLLISGIYFIKIEIHNRSVIKKFILF